MNPRTPLLLAALLPFAAGLHAAPKPAAPKVKEATTGPATPAGPAAPAAQPVVEPIAIPAGARGYNRLVLEAITRMPLGGGYSVKSPATANLVAATTFQKDPKGGLGLRHATAQPSYCSGATYIIFLDVVSELVKAGKLKLSPEALAMLPVKRQADGVGVWGRWNANGPGTGRFFHELRLGTNIIGLDQAEPGDFLKVWWNEHVGKRERGHSVIFLGHEKTPEGEPGIRFWSANEPEGMSAKVVPLTKIKRALISRLEHPENLVNLPKLPPKDAFLASMLEVDCGEQEYLQSIGLAAAPPAEDAGKGEKIKVHIDGVPEAKPAAGGPKPDAEKAPAAPSGAVDKPGASKTPPVRSTVVPLRKP